MRKGLVVWLFLICSSVKAAPFQFINSPYSIGIELDGLFQGVSPNPGQGYHAVPWFTDSVQSGKYYGPLAEFCTDGEIKSRKVTPTIEYFVTPRILPSGGGSEGSAVFDLVISYGVRAWKVEKYLENPSLYSWAVFDGVGGEKFTQECGGRFFSSVRYGVQAIGTYKLRVVRSRANPDEIYDAFKDLYYRYIDETGLLSSDGRQDSLAILQARIAEIEPRIEQLGSKLNFLVRSWRETDLPHLHKVRGGDADLRLTDELELFVQSYLRGEDVWGDPVSATVNRYDELGNKLY